VRLALLIAVAGCEAASPDPGLGARLQIPGAQFRPGAFPADTGGPATLAVQPDHATVTIGRLHDQLHGVFDHGSTSVVIGIDGVDGAWLVAAGAPSFDMPDEPTVTETYGFSEQLPLGPTTIVMAAGNADGDFGPAGSSTVIAAADDPPGGELVISLEWDSTADLDLHVVDPLGGEAWSDSPNTWQPPPPGDPPPPPDAFLTGGILDHDGNANCHRDGHPNEHVIWQMPPPSGNYVVRVDARMMCSDASAAWAVTAYRSGTVIGASRGVSTNDDADVSNHGVGAGQLALQFTLP